MHRLLLVATSAACLSASGCGLFLGLEEGQLDTGEQVAASDCPPPAGSGCAPGPCQAATLVDAVTAGTPFGIAVAEGYVVWADRPGKVLRVRDSNGSITTIEGDQETARASIHGGFAYWTEGDGPSLYRAELPSGGRKRLGTHAGASGSRGQLAVSDSGAYWVHEPPNAAVLSSPLDAQTDVPTEVAPVNLDEEAAGVAVDGEHVYWTLRSQDSILRKPLNEIGDGQPGHIVSKKANGAIDLAVDAAHIYWIDDGSERANVKRARKDGAGSAETLAELTDLPTSLVVDDLYVYWTTDKGSVYRTAKDGGGDEKMLASGESEAHDLAQDCGALYWTTDAEGIRTVAK